MRDLAPNIYRQRLVIEGHQPRPISDIEIKQYLKGLGPVLNMHVLIDPVTHRSDKFGWSGWVHWETSGAHFYAWEQPLLFFSVDIYTCKSFEPEVARKYTEDFFGTKQLELGEF